MYRLLAIKCNNLLREFGDIRDIGDMNIDIIGGYYVSFISY